MPHRPHAPEGAESAIPFRERRDEILDLVAIITERCQPDHHQRLAAIDVFDEVLPGLRDLAEACQPASPGGKAA